MAATCVFHISITSTRLARHQLPWQWWALPLLTALDRHRHLQRFVSMLTGIWKASCPALQEEKELGWGGFDDVAPALKTTVVLKRMFVPEEFEADASLREQLQDDVGAEARKFGEAHTAPMHTPCPRTVSSVEERLRIKLRERLSCTQCDRAQGQWRRSRSTTPTRRALSPSSSTTSPLLSRCLRCY